MDPERWRQVEQLFHCAQERDPGDRAAFLVQACQGDQALRGEVESLLDQRNKSGYALLGRPAWEVAPNPVDGATETCFGPGTQLGPYRIEAILGKGGMGEVFRAKDTRLSRAVAIKVILPSRRHASDNTERFIQEARAASALNHPHIVTIYDVGSKDDLLYLVMELIDGQTLRDVLATGPLPTPKLLTFAIQIGDALATAHAKGIMHRDLKPANIMITADGRAKIVDFGLAKLTTPQDVSTLSQPTVSLHTVTRPGTLMGTFGYMSPEQAQGGPVDLRADQFSLGAVLYEMATGRRAFKAASAYLVDSASPNR